MNKQVVLGGLMLLTACSVQLGQGPSSGSDVVQPLWQETSTYTAPATTLPCNNVVALLIGIGRYASGSGWEPLQTQNDVATLTESLLKQGVNPAHIHRLMDGQATRAGILQALQTMADTLSPGTQLIVLYAGHGRQVPDDNGDEADGYDEALVPFDAPASSQTTTQGYLRDDVLNYYLARVRATLGPVGSLWLLFDSCHSATLNRGRVTVAARGGVAPVGLPAPRPKRARPGLQPGSDWYETPDTLAQLAPYVLFAATTDNGPNFETTDAQGRPMGPLTRALSEVWHDDMAGQTYRVLFNRVAMAMARFAPYQQPTLAGEADILLPGCGQASAPQSFFQTTGEPLRVAWPRNNPTLTRLLLSVPFVQPADRYPDLTLVRQKRGYVLTDPVTQQPLTKQPLPPDACAEQLRQFFARNVLFRLHQVNPALQVQCKMQRVAVRTENGQTVVADTLPDQTETGTPIFYARPDERVLLTFTNVGTQPYYLTVVDLLPDGRFHILLPEANALPADYRLRPGQSLRRRVRITEPFGAEVYKLLLTPDPIDLRAVLQTRGNSPIQHPYEALFQRTYATRGLPETTALGLSDKAGATAEVAFWVKQ